MIVDTHVHITPAEGAAPHAEAATRWEQGTVTGDELIGLMANGGVARAVLVQASRTDNYDNSYMVNTAAAHPEFFSTVCCVDVREPDADDRLAYWVHDHGVGGVRLFNAMTDGEHPWLDDPKTLKVIEMAGKLGIVVTMASRHSDLSRVRAVAERFPQVTFTLDHLGHMPNQERPPHDNSDEFLALAEYVNLNLKFSAVNQWAASKGIIPSGEYFKTIFDSFGPRRLLWGSNYPPTRFKPYPELAKMGPEAFAFATAEEQQLIMGGNALRLWPSKS